MATQRRKFTEEEKLHILQLAKQTNISSVLRAYNLSYSVFSRWKLQAEKDPVMNTKEDFINLKNENILLKRIVADQALELEIKKEKGRK